MTRDALARLPALRRHRVSSLVLICMLSALAPGTVMAQDGDAPRTRLRTLRGTGITQKLMEPIPREQLRRPDLAEGSGTLPAIMLTGYWPPTNEMLRRFSPDPVQNPNGWQGANWEGRGYDVYAYFPEFTPPTCVFCGQGSGDLEVDYQDTSNDFWPLANNIAPVALMTFSRGFPDESWEVEMNQFNRATWIADFTAPIQPTPSPPDASVPAEFLRPSTLPVQAIVDEIVGDFPAADAFICFTGDGGGFLSEFIGYHGVWYQDLHSAPNDPALSVTAGHIHVGQNLPIARGRAYTQSTLRAVITHLDTVLRGEICQTDLGFGGPGTSQLSVCGDALASGGQADLSLTGALPGASIWYVLGQNNNPLPFKGGQLLPVPILGLVTATADGNGDHQIAALPGGGGPFTLYVQAVSIDAAQPFGFALSNALALEFEL
ncbi:MAG: hypothetical protein ACI9EF_000298 [Pseudohongiellaceae bacterium]|jgi:hypothetical protein